MIEAAKKAVIGAIRAKGTSRAAIAQALGVAPQQFNDWLNKPNVQVPEKHVPGLADLISLAPDAINPDAADRWRKALRLHPPVEPKVITDIGPISARALGIARTFDALTPARQQIIDLLLHEWFAGEAPEPKKPRRTEHKSHAPG